jgi:hypothetical protein
VNFLKIIFWGFQRLFFCFWGFFTLNPENSYISYMKTKLNVFIIMILTRKVRCVKFFKLVWGKTFSKDFFNAWKVVCVRLILPKMSLLMSYIDKPNHVFYRWWSAMSSNKSWTHFEFMSWFMCKNHKNEYLCCIIFASPLIFVQCAYLLWLCRLDCQFIFKG